MEAVIAKDRAEWRRWLGKNFARREEIWLVFYKKGTGKPAVSYEHAVEEALCFGWIDGMKAAGSKAYNSGDRREAAPGFASSARRGRITKSFRRLTGA
jgi:uncharacterized protein YdeI (YjbR/CyaY-like superfamily)